MTDQVNDGTLLEVRNLKKYFPAAARLFSRSPTFVKAVDGIDFSIKKGETLGIVGESGCGKSTTGRMLAGLLRPTGGEAVFDGQNIFNLSARERREVRGEIQIVFQDPYGSLNPRMTAYDIVGEPLKLNGIKRREREVKVRELLNVVGLGTYHHYKYPQEFSGGQRQRIGIARALALRPKFIICDEPVSALDVSIQSQIINLLKDLQSEFSLTYMFISHDLSIIKHISNRVGVMYLGKIVELGPVDQMFLNPQHPYTKALLSAVPVPDPEAHRTRIILKGDVPNPINIPDSCRFNTRCPYVLDVCNIEEPEFLGMGGGHFVACHIAHRA